MMEMLVALLFAVLFVISAERTERVKGLEWKFWRLIEYFSVVGLTVSMLIAVWSAIGG